VADLLKRRISVYGSAKYAFFKGRELVIIRDMLDPRLLREEPDKVKEGIASKNSDPKLVDTFLELDKKWRETVTELENWRSEQKKLSAARDIEGGKRNKETIKELEAKAADLEKEREEVWMQIPNIADEDVPVGKDESGNKVIRTWGEIPQFDFEPKDHIELGEKLGIIEIEKAGKITGTRFNYLMGDAARIQYAIVQMVFDKLTDPEFIKDIAEKIEPDYSAKPFIPVVPPVMIRPDVYRRVGRLDATNEDEKYYMPKDDLYLIGSAEHTLAPLHMDESIPEKDLPIRYIGFSPAFRRESGSYGKDVRGILRVHQFDKLEMESFTAPENSHKEQDLIVAIQENLMQALKIPYQVMSICTGDMGAPDSKQIDIEAWMPSQNRYRETHTSDLIGDYQARRLNTKIKRKDGKSEILHMNDATAFAIGRILIAIMENNQTADGKIRIPEVLRPYLGGKEFIGG
jgi:seryl-tRNA synthetase